MELFYSNNIGNGICTLAEEESRHCSKVLRHVPGDTINVIDGCGSMYRCTIMECGKQVICNIEEQITGFGAHSYHLTMAVCPTKNIDRYEWFLEKATEMGVDVVVPVIGEHSERRIIKPERLEKILVSAAKQSLKGAVPVLRETVTVKEFIRNVAPLPGVKLIAYCGEQEKVTLAEAIAMAQELACAPGGTSCPEHASCPEPSCAAGTSGAVCCPAPSSVPGVSDVASCPEPSCAAGTSGAVCCPAPSSVPGVSDVASCPEQADAAEEVLCALGKNFPSITILIGPEGDFSPAEVDTAIAAGFLPLTLGTSRLRTETAAVAAVAGVYFMI